MNSASKGQSRRTSSRRTVWLVRHAHRQDMADPAWPDRSPRPHDPPLSTHGHAQARRLAQRLRLRRIDHLFCSPFLRAMDTAAPVARATNLKVKVEHGLCEVLLKKWFPHDPTLLPLSMLSRRYSRIDPAYRSVCRPRWPEAHSGARRRGRDTMRRLLSAYDGNLLLITHGAIMARLCGALIGPAACRIEIPFCCLLELRLHDGRWRLKTRDLAHPRKEKSPGVQPAAA